MNEDFFDRMNRIDRIIKKPPRQRNYFPLSPAGERARVRGKMPLSLPLSFVCLQTSTFNLQPFSLSPLAFRPAPFFYGILIALILTKEKNNHKRR